MKYFVLNEGEAPAAIIFSDSFHEEFYIRSKVESLSIIFDAIRKRDSIKLIKGAKNVVAKLNDAMCSVEVQVTTIIDEICSSERWHLGATGEAESEDSVISQYISQG